MEPKTIEVAFQLDENGLFGRECPVCFKYFKLKMGTGIKTTLCSCPYCDHRGEGKEFYTQDQIAYLHSVLSREVIKPKFDDLANQVNRSGTPSNNGWLQVSIHMDVPEFPIEHYQEKTLETNITCDNCGLVFSIYGVFSNCPDCGKLNARVIYGTSLDAANKQLELARNSEIDASLQSYLIKNALGEVVSAFDSLGKALRKKHPEIQSRTRNLFQNLFELDRVLVELTGKCIAQYLTEGDSEFVFTMFQVRHIYEHNAGVIDSDFVEKIPALAGQLGRKYILSNDNVSVFISLMRKLGNEIYGAFEK
jgi:hypothetical protein